MHVLHRSLCACLCCCTRLPCTTVTTRSSICRLLRHDIVGPLYYVIQAYQDMDPAARAAQRGAGRWAAAVGRGLVRCRHEAARRCSSARQRRTSTLAIPYLGAVQHATRCALPSCHLRYRFAQQGGPGALQGDLYFYEGVTVVNVVARPGAEVHFMVGARGAHAWTSRGAWHGMAWRGACAVRRLTRMLRRAGPCFHPKHECQCPPPGFLPPSDPASLALHLHWYPSHIAGGV